MTPGATSYYKPLSSLGTEELNKLCAPLDVMDEATHPQGIGVRHIDSDGHWFDNSNPSSIKLQNYMSGVCAAIADLAHQSDPYPEIARQKLDWKASGIDLSGDRFIDPSIVTGKLVRMSVSAVAPTELPFAMNDRYKDAVMVGGHALRGYFRLVGTLKIGGTTTMTACAISATAISERKTQISGGNEFTWLHRYFKTNVKRYSGTSATALWEQIRQQAATNDAIRRMRPFGHR